MNINKIIIMNISQGFQLAEFLGSRLITAQNEEGREAYL
jgi:hypothetical protein